MFTLFDLLRVVGMLAGATAGARCGWQYFGVIGAVAGGAAGIIIGGMIGQLPLVILLKLQLRHLKKMSSFALRTGLHQDECLTPNIFLLELSRRGEDIEMERPFVYSLLTSSELSKRITGWAALTSAFPDLARSIPGYRPTKSVAECRRICESLADGEDKERKG